MTTTSLATHIRRLEDDRRDARRSYHIVAPAMAHGKPTIVDTVTSLIVVEHMFGATSNSNSIY